MIKQIIFGLSRSMRAGMPALRQMQILVATKNAGKIKEIEELLSDLPIQLRSLKEFENIPEAEETGKTFAENAAIKAKFYARQTGLWSLADDSGLAVEALGGAPGFFSARYAGENSSYAEKIGKLLKELEAANDENRRAAFVCVAAIADEKGEIKFSAEGVCRGEISREPRGANGFGYDPIFVPEGFDKTLGELSVNIKQEISHRARAVRKIIRFLGDFTAI
ncbi:MAG TPA: XTP/dITP diphosphatase [Pyrinomonadaceae bacterium]|nr:XTP/dITP diphosphatase [Pyrinomonadaceae bacterium]